MKEWLRGILGALGLGLIWAVVWAAAGALKRAVDASGSLDELWLGPAIGMQPGFLGGVLFSVVLAIAATGRTLGALSLARVLACGGMAGLLVGVLPFAINKPPTEAPLWLVGVAVIGSMTLLGAVSAAGSLVVARRTSAGR